MTENNCIDIGGETLLPLTLEAEQQSKQSEAMQNALRDNQEVEDETVTE